MNEFRLETFKNFTLEDKVIIQQYFKKYPQCSCDYNFANLFCWGDFLNAKWSVFERKLIIYNTSTDFILMPVGNWPAIDEMLYISDVFRKNGKSGNFILVPHKYIHHHEHIKDHFEVIPNEDNADYIYCSKKLVELKGKKLQKKKNLVSQFRRAYPDYEVKVITKNDAAICLKLAEKWLEDKESELYQDMLLEFDVLKKAFDNYEAIDMEDLMILVDNQVIAFALFNEQRDCTATVHFEKFDYDIKGSAQIINWETAKYLKHRYNFINREQDLGIPGLRRAKKSYMPDKWLIKNKLIRK